jgi:K+ transporter
LLPPFLPRLQITFTSETNTGQIYVPAVNTLLFIGVMVPMVVYTLWGVIDILTVPLAK